MNKNQRERMVEIQSELKRKQEMDEETKREALEKKLQKAAENYTKKVGKFFIAVRIVDNILGTIIPDGIIRW